MKTFTLNIVPKKLPKVVCDEKGIVITGRSIPENPIDVYSPVIEWIKNEFSNSEKKVLIDLEYFNSSTMVYLITILQHVFKIAPDSEVTWLHDDDDDIAYLLTGSFDLTKIKFVKKDQI